MPPSTLTFSAELSKEQLLLLNDFVVECIAEVDYRARLAEEGAAAVHGAGSTANEEGEVQDALGPPAAIRQSPEASRPRALQGRFARDVADMSSSGDPSPSLASRARNVNPPFRPGPVARPTPSASGSSDISDSQSGPVSALLPGPTTEMETASTQDVLAAGQQLPAPAPPPAPAPTPAAFIHPTFPGLRPTMPPFPSAPTNIPGLSGTNFFYASPVAPPAFAPHAPLPAAQAGISAVHQTPFPDSSVAPAQGPFQPHRPFSVHAQGSHSLIAGAATNPAPPAPQTVGMLRNPFLPRGPAASAAGSHPTPSLRTPMLPPIPASGLSSSIAVAPIPTPVVPPKSSPLLASSGVPQGPSTGARPQGPAFLVVPPSPAAPRALVVPPAAPAGVPEGARARPALPPPQPQSYPVQNLAVPVPQANPVLSNHPPAASATPVSPGLVGYITAPPLPLGPSTALPAPGPVGAPAGAPSVPPNPPWDSANLPPVELPSSKALATTSSVPSQYKYHVPYEAEDSYVYGNMGSDQSVYGKKGADPGPHLQGGERTAQYASEMAGFTDSAYEGGASSISRAAQEAPKQRGWTRVHNSDPSFHDNQFIRSLKYVRQLPSWKAKPDNAGFLISGCDKLLNLWECSKSSGKGGESIELFTSAETAFTPMSLDAVESSRISLCASWDAHGCYVHVQSLDGSNVSSLFKTRARIPLPPTGYNKKVLPHTNTLHSHVRSLQSWAPEAEDYKNRCFVTYDSLLLEYDTRISMEDNPVPTTVINTGNSMITALCVSNYSPDVFAGTQGGDIYRCDFRERPRNKQLIAAAGNLVTGIHMHGSNLMVSSTLGGKVTLWDVSQNRRPVHSWNLPEGIVKSELSPGKKEFLAVATNNRHVRLVDLKVQSKDLPPSYVTAKELEGPINALTWTGVTSEVVVAVGNRIQIYRLLLQ